MRSVSDDDRVVKPCQLQNDRLALEVAGETTVSPALLAANRLLHQKRQAQTQSRPHNAWLSSFRIALERNHEQSSKTNDPPEVEANLADNVRVYPSMAHAAIKQGCVPAYRVWLLLRQLDQTGCGWLDKTAVFGRLARKSADLKICGKRRLNQILRAGERLFWERHNGRIWIAGAAKVCERLQVDKLVGRAVLIPLVGLTGSLQLCRAHLYATVHSRRPHSAPIARVTIETITGASERSQRQYDNLLNTERTTCFHIDKPFTNENRLELHWQFGHSFKFVDRQGKIGAPGAAYVARQMGNQYNVAQHVQTATGRKKKINRHLNTLDLVNKQAQGNEQTNVIKQYFPNVVVAAKAHRKRSEPAYWQPSQTSHRCSLWLQVGCG